MSFSSEVKNCILKNAENIKNECCRNAFEAGINGAPYVKVCEGCGRYYAAGVFYTYGSVSDPKKTTNLYINAPSDVLGTVNSILSGNDILMRQSKQKGKDILYIRNNNGVEDFLTFIGASQFSVRVMEINVLKTLRIEQNRANNAEVANLDRASTASAEQQKAIKTLMADKRLYTLSKDYIYTAEMRMKNPELTVPELAELFEPKISKSGLNHRLKKLIELASQPTEKKQKTKKEKA